MRLCGFKWTTNEGKPGSRHECALEDHHLGPCECGSPECNEVCFHLVAEPPPYDAVNIELGLNDYDCMLAANGAL